MTKKYLIFISFLHQSYQSYVVIGWQVLLASNTSSAVSVTGPSVGWTGGEVFWGEAPGGACGCDWCMGAATAVVSGVPFSGILCKMKAERHSTNRYLYIHLLWCNTFFFFSLTLFGVWIGDRASRSVMGNSRPRLLRSSYTYTTPAKEGELRNASAQDWRWEGEQMMKDYENGWLFYCCLIT